jgi:hypothetical protein
MASIQQDTITDRQYRKLRAAVGLHEVAAQVRSIDKLTELPLAAKREMTRPVVI